MGCRDYCCSRITRCNKLANMEYIDPSNRSMLYAASVSVTQWKQPASQDIMSAALTVSGLEFLVGETTAKVVR
ncbi:hypothetical protein I7I53_11456 [Histoplasma capsulatum var. duboisii H88]|uniref:Uncharacterized protein n=1 Tax=Ajellomyces capsulatus (strain H88) TaxID=544711 RepID=A0A8A1L9Q1_AJEC8|nr:hypothetical protein I7I53_11456 [Histoplasma capsulatum var. duboisii H88]